MKIIIAPDSFKDALSSRGVAEAIQEGIKKASPTAKEVASFIKRTSHAPSMSNNSFISFATEVPYKFSYLDTSWVNKAIPFS